jgi:hypothetical protein
VGCGFTFGLWLNLRPGGATREMWRMPDGRGGEWCIFTFGAPKVVARD